MSVLNDLVLGLGYSRTHTRTSAHAQLLNFLFGHFVELHFHVEQFSFDTVRVTVAGTRNGIEHIFERFTGTHGSVHQTKNGALLKISINKMNASVTIEHPEFVAFNGTNEVAATMQ